MRGWILYRVDDEEGGRYQVELVDKFFEGRLIDNLKPDEIRVERDGGTVLRLRMHAEHPIVGVNAPYQELDAETLIAQIPYLPVVLLVDTLHYQFHQQRAFEY